MGYLDGDEPITEGIDITEMEISRDDERSADAGSPDFFTGDVSVQPVFGINDHRNTSARQVTFGPRARCAWGGPKQQINPGDVAWTPPDAEYQG
jgi:quercetin dioxygenase-like cupin family protein